MAVGDSRKRRPNASLPIGPEVTGRISDGNDRSVRSRRSSALPADVAAAFVMLRPTALSPLCRCLLPPHLCPPRPLRHLSSPAPAHNAVIPNPPRRGGPVSGLRWSPPDSRNPRICCPARGAPFLFARTRPRPCHSEPQGSTEPRRIPPTVPANQGRARADKSHRGAHLIPPGPR
jgi:hypothetical protein